MSDAQGAADDGPPACAPDLALRPQGLPRRQQRRRAGSWHRPGRGRRERAASREHGGWGHHSGADRQRLPGLRLDPLSRRAGCRRVLPDGDGPHRWARQHRWPRHFARSPTAQPPRLPSRRATAHDPPPSGIKKRAPISGIICMAKQHDNACNMNVSQREQARDRGPAARIRPRMRRISHSADPQARPG